MTQELVYIGYWYSPREPQYPRPIERSACSTEVLKQSYVLDWIERSGTVIYYRGWSTCRICGAMNGTREFAKMLDGKEHRFPEGLKHYVEVHKVLVPGLLKLYKYLTPQ